MCIRSAVIAAAVVVLSAGTLTAQPFESKGSVGGWNIFSNAATGGCFMERQTPEGQVLQVGSQQAMLGAGENDKFSYLAVYSPGEAPAVDNEKPLVIVQIGPSLYVGQAVTSARDGYWGGYVLSDQNNDLEFDLLKRSTMVVETSNGGKITVKLNRTGTGMRDAMKMTRACQNG